MFTPLVYDHLSLNIIRDVIAREARKITIERSYELTSRKIKANIALNRLVSMLIRTRRRRHRHRVFWHDHHINNSIPPPICIPPCSVFRRHNRLISGRLVAQRCRARLLPDSSGALVSALATKSRGKKDAAKVDGVERDDRSQHDCGTTYPGLQPSETTD